MKLFGGDDGGKESFGDEKTLGEDSADATCGDDIIGGIFLACGVASTSMSKTVFVSSSSAILLDNVLQNKKHKWFTIKQFFLPNRKTKKAKKHPASFQLCRRRQCRFFYGHTSTKNFCMLLKTYPPPSSHHHQDRKRNFTTIMASSCSAPGCTEPGTNKCSSCKITLYCCVACQTIDWPQHKGECQGHLRKLGVANLEKARVFDVAYDWVQSLRLAELSLKSLRKLQPRPLEVIMLLDDALRFKFNALNCTNLKQEALECAEERYSLWAAGHMRNPLMLEAAFPLIEGLTHTNDHEQAILIARTAYEMIINDTEKMIPSDHYPFLLAQASEYLASATFGLSVRGGIPPAEKKKAGEEAIALARKALELHTELQGYLQLCFLSSSCHCIWSHSYHSFWSVCCCCLYDFLLLKGR